MVRARIPSPMVGTFSHNALALGNPQGTCVADGLRASPTWTPPLALTGWTLHLQISHRQPISNRGSMLVQLKICQ
ncbi:hypothetical protein Ancab_017072 [Ancistrocladus abbreviatus]